MRDRRVSSFGLVSIVLALIGAMHVGDVVAAPDAKPRVALVVGNSSYRTSPLENPVNDARAMSQALREAGFQVTTLENASQRQMFDAIRGFGDTIARGSVGLFYYAGHGVQVKGRNFLIPVDVVIEREDEVPYKGVDIGQVLDKMEAARNPLNVVIIDACRNNPFARKGRSGVAGLAQIDAPVGTLIAFATAPGAEASDGDSDGKNGLYTQYLLQYMNQPGLKAEDVFKRVRVAVRQKTNGRQIPWENTSLEGDFYFTPPTVAEATVAAQAKRDPELELWSAIKDSRNPYDYKTYLERYPQGQYSADARKRFAELEQPTTVVAAQQRTNQDDGKPARSSQTFSFSRAEEEAARRYEARQQGGLADIAQVPCSQARKSAPIRVEINEQFLKGLAVIAQQKGGSSGDAIAARLRGVGLNVAASGTPQYFLRGSVTSQANASRVLRVNEIAINTALTLTDASGAVVGTVLHREESFAGDDLYTIYAGLISRQAATVAAQVYRDLCEASRGK